jgi:hypothetical protein
MKLSKILFYIVIIFMLSVLSYLQAQTAVSDSGNAAPNGVYKYEVTYAGYLHGTDTVITQSFDKRQYDTTATFWYKFTEDSVNIKIIMQASGLSGEWLTVKTISDSVKSSTVGYFNYYFSEKADSYRIVFIGRTGNAYKTQFVAKMILYRRE